MNRKIMGLILGIIFFILSFLIVMILSDFPSLPAKSRHSSKTCAIAIRDSVSNFQKLGSKMFTTHYLEKIYGSYFYFTQYSGIQNYAAIFYLDNILIEASAAGIILSIAGISELVVCYS